MTIRQTAAARSLVFCDWGIQRKHTPSLLDDLPLLAELQATHLTVGVHSIHDAEQHHRWRLLGDVAQDGERLVQGIHNLGAVPCFHVWMVPDEAFLRAAAQQLADLAQEWGVGAIVGNPELPWWGTSKPQLLKDRPAEEQRRLQEAAEADHAALGLLFIEELRNNGFTGDIWISTFFWTPPATRRLIQASNGLIAQMMSFSNKRKPQTLGTAMWPGRRQLDAWDRLQGWRRPDDPQWTMWGQQAVYHQEAFAEQLGVTQATTVRVAAHTYLGGAASHSEANLAWWSWLWLRGRPDLRRVVASYSPRSGNPLGWYS